MTKKNLYYEKAEELYVVEQMTIKEIALKLNLSHSTISEWKKDGEWTIKRKNFIESKKNFHKELKEFGKKLLYSLNDDFSKGQKPNAREMHVFTKILPLIMNNDICKQEVNLD